MNNLYVFLNDVDKVPANTPYTFWDYFWWVMLIVVIMIPWVVIVLFWIFKRYRVMFFGMNGEVLSSKTYKKNTLIEFPLNVEVPGYTFEGWYEDKDLLYPLSFNYVTESNVKLYGKWIKNEEV